MGLLFDSGSPVADGATWATALIGRLSTAMSSLLNEFGLVIQGIVNPSAATASYEKDLLTVQGLQTDPSDPAKGIMKMGVAGDFRMKIAGNNPTGYAYGLYVESGSDPGSAGQQSGAEIGGNNQGGPSAPYGQFGCAFNLTLVAGEYANCFNQNHAMSIVGGSAQYDDAGIIIETAALAPGAVALRIVSNTTGRDVFRITADGTLQYSKLEQIQ